MASDDSKTTRRISIQDIGAIVTSLGVIAGFYFNYVALCEIRLDRELHAKEVSETREQHQREIADGHTREDVHLHKTLSAEVLPVLNITTSSFYISRTGNVANETASLRGNSTGFVKNFGRGSAKNVRAKWIPVKYDSGDSSVPHESVEFNLSPSTFSPGETASLTELPKHVVGPVFRSMEGTFEVHCDDIHGNHHFKAFSFTVKLTEAPTDFLRGQTYPRLVFNFGPEVEQVD
jgi:hypothetical protein